MAKKFTFFLIKEILITDQSILKFPSKWLYCIRLLKIRSEYSCWKPVKALGLYLSELVYLCLEDLLGHIQVLQPLPQLLILPLQARALLLHGLQLTVQTKGHAFRNLKEQYLAIIRSLHNINHPSILTRELLTAEYSLSQETSSLP